ncbi:hypothetical protein DRN69_08680 [Candidatus Pacearchaeota archaeon]|nr:MAG: hypothetical protein DRN69_08680 [Candidatus Pacearchaeota archaeon]
MLKRKKKDKGILCIGDVHAGFKKVNSEGRQVWGIYNIKKEFEYLNKIMKHFCEEHVSIDELHVFLLGDIVHGASNYRTQLWEAEMAPTIATEKITDILTNFFLQLKKDIKIPIIVTCQTGNHGRKRREQAIPTYLENEDLTVYLNLKERLKGKVKVNIPKWYWTVVQVDKKRFLITHGDAINMYSRIPWYGLREFIQSNKLILKKSNRNFEAVIIGHFHNMFNWDMKGIEVFCNGTLQPQNRFTWRIGLTPSKAFWFIGVKGKRIAWRYQIDFSRKRRFKK